MQIQKLNIIPSNGLIPTGVMTPILRDDGYRFYVLNDEIFVSKSTLKKLFSINEKKFQEMLPHPCLIAPNPHRTGTVMCLYKFQRAVNTLEMHDA